MSLTAQYVYHTLLCIYKSALFCHMDILETAIPRKYTSPILFATVFKKYAALDRIKGSFYSVHLRNLYLFSLCVPRLWTGEGNGTPLQYSCLENPMDGGAWQAAVHGVAESDMAERLPFHFSLSCIGEGNGSPLRCSCLENLRDQGAWWAAVPGVAQSRTRLMQLSRSSSSLCKNTAPRACQHVYYHLWYLC